MIIPKNEFSVRGYHVTNTIGYEDVVDKFFSNKTIILLYLSITIYCIPLASIAVARAAIDSGVAMEDKMEVVFQNSSFNSLLYQYVMYPLLHFDFSLLAYALIKRRKDWFSLSVYIAYLIEFMLLAGGRSILIVFLLYVVIVYVCATSKSKIKTINIKKILTLTGLVVIVIYSISILDSYRKEGVLSVSRNSTEETLIASTTEKIISYSILPIALFNHAIENGVYDKYQYKYGRATFAGVDVLVGGVAKRIGIPYQSTMEIVNDVQEEYVQIGPDARYNYAYTSMFYHYIDLGVLGIILFPFLLGIIYRSVIKRFYRNPTFSRIILIGLCFFIMMHSFFTCYFIKSWVVPYIFLLLYLSRNGKKNKLNIAKK